MIYHYYGLKHQSEDKIWARLKEQRESSPKEEFIRTFKLCHDAKSSGLHYVWGRAVYDDEKKAFALSGVY